MTKLPLAQKIQAALQAEDAAIQALPDGAQKDAATAAHTKLHNLLNAGVKVLVISGVLTSAESKTLGINTDGLDSNYQPDDGEPKNQN